MFNRKDTKKKTINRIISMLLAVLMLLPAAVIAPGEAFADISEIFTIDSAAGAGIEENTDDPAKGSSMRKKITAKNTPQVKKLDLNLRKLLGESSSGFSVVQGGCTDGKYAYYLMVSSYTQRARVLKLRISDNKVMAKSGEINICHGNGVALDTKRHRLVVVGRDGRRNQLTIIKTGTGAKDEPVFDSYDKVNYKYSEKWATSKSRFDGLGLAAISYIKKYDCFVALQRKSHDILVLDPDFKVIGFIGTSITSKYPGMYQAMDADERYVYLLLSYYNSSQPYNRILALDWNSEHLKDYAKGKVKFVKKAWSCNDSENGSPDTDIRIRTKYEAENIYHVDNGKGKARFYLSEYYNDPTYHWVTKKKAYKVKWKQVTKKVKWKKVNGEWKYKTKKVWKYKTKYKKIRVREVDHYNRQNYVYDLGIL